MGVRGFGGRGWMGGWVDGPGAFCHRLAFSVVCEMLEDGTICGEPWVGRSVVRNRHTFDYKTATLVMAGDSDAAAKCDPDVVASLQLLAAIAQRRRRYCVCRVGAGLEGGRGGGEDNGEPLVCCQVPACVPCDVRRKFFLTYPFSTCPPFPPPPPHTHAHPSTVPGQRPET